MNCAAILMQRIGEPESLYCATLTSPSLPPPQLGFATVGAPNSSDCTAWHALLHPKEGGSTRFLNWSGFSSLAGHINFHVFSNQRLQFSSILSRFTITPDFEY